MYAQDPPHVERPEHVVIASWRLNGTEVDAGATRG
jgi:hypothetical protein